MKSSFLTYTAVLLLFSWTAISQPVNNLIGDVTMPPPSSAALGKFVDVPVGYYTGVPNIGIPIHTVQDGPVSLSVSLSYHAGGVRVGEPADWVGLNWALNAGGMISRTVQGRPDDETSGYLSGDELDIPQDYDYPDCPYDAELDDSDYLDLSMGQKDGEPDIFSFNVGGYTGKFYLRPNGDVVMVPLQDVKIRHNYDSGRITQFVMTAPDGTKYIFGSTGTGTSGIETTENGDQFAYVTGWKLRRIESYDGHYAIGLTYEEEVYSYTSKGSWSNPGGSKPNQVSKVVGKRLVGISSPTTTLTFVPSDEPREDLEDEYLASTLEGAYSLKDIEIETGTFCKRFHFEYGYWEDDSEYKSDLPCDKRLKLLSVQETACEEGPSVPPYTFTYYGKQGDNDFLPNRLSPAMDHWGFYNGQDRPHTDPAAAPVELSVTYDPEDSPPHQFEFVRKPFHREVSEEHAKWGTLEKMALPTGGYQLFEYESNTANNYNGEAVIQTFIGQVTNLCPYGTDCGQTGPGPNTAITGSGAGFTYEDDANVEFHFITVRPCETATGSHYVDVTLKEGGADLATITLNFTEGDITEIFPSVDFEDGHTYSFAFSVLGVCLDSFKLYRYETVNNIEKVGGLRIKKITLHDNKDHANDIVRDFAYTSGAILDESSGHLFNRPRYWAAFAVPDPHSCYAYFAGVGQVLVSPTTEEYADTSFYVCEPVAGFPIFEGCDDVYYGDVDYYFAVHNYGYSVTPLSGFDGGHIGYERVVESQEGTGATIYNYSLDEAPEPANSPYAPPPYIDLGDISSEELTTVYPLPPTQPNINAGNLTSVRMVATDNGDASITTNTPFEDDYVLSDEGDPMVKATRVAITITDPPAIFYTHYRIRTRPAYRLASVTEERDGVTKETEYHYDDQGRFYMPISVSVENSDGKFTETRYSYPHDLAYTCLRDELVARNMIGSPTSTKTFVEETLVSGDSTRYSNFDASTGLPGGSCTGDSTNTDFPYAWEFYRYEVELDASNEPVGTGAWVRKGEVEERDTDNGKPKYFTQVGWETEEYTWDATSKLITSRTYEDFTWTYDYLDGTGLLSSITGIDGQVAEYSYDGLMRLHEASARGGAVTTSYEYAYGSNNRVTTTTDYADDTPMQTNMQTFDGLGRPLKTYHNLVLKNEVKYDKIGRVAQQTYLPGNLLTLGYEGSPLSRPVMETYPDGSQTLMSYGHDGDYYKVTATDEDGKESHMLTDILGRPCKSVDPLDGETVNTYDYKNNLVKVVTPMGDDGDYNFLFRYDERNRLVEKKIPGMDESYGYTYYDNDLLETTTDPNGNVVTNEYDDYGRPTVIKHNSTTVMENTYDVGGGINLGKLTESEAKEVGGAASFVTEYGYDAFGRIATTTKSNQLGGSDVVTNAWNDADWMETATRVHTISGADPLTIVQGYEHDKFGRVTESTHSVGSLGTILAQNTWNNRDQLTSKMLGGGLQRLSYAYNERGWLTSINQPLDRFAETGPMSACDEAAEGNGGDVFCGGSDVSLPVLNSMRFDEDIRIECYDPCALTGGLVQDPVCNGADPQSDLADALAAMGANYTEQVEHPCEDSTTETSARPVAGSLPFPAKLCRVRLCDSTEVYIFESEIGELTEGSYAILQEIQVTSPTQTFTINSGTGKGQQEVTLTALLGMVVKGNGTLAVNNYVQGLTPCVPLTKECSEGETELQQASLTAIMEASAFINFNHAHKYPMKLYRVILCDGTETYLFEFELSQLYGSYTILQTITVTSVDQTFQVGGTIATIDLKDLFYLGLQYGKQNGLNAQLEAPAQKNGNIAGMTWQVAGREMQAYGFQYDGLNRLKQAKYADIASDGVYRLNDRYNERLSYDAIGNILSLERHGVLPDELNPGCFLEDRVDVLAYSYDGNRLTGVADSAPGDFVDKGFRPGGGSGSYSYDDNGNMTSDPYKDLEITYNYLNLPSFVAPSGIGGSINFSYDATGRKYRKVVVGTGGHTQDYVDGIEYRDSELEAIYTEEGRVAKDGEGNLRYEFTISDHLGNARVMFADLNEDGRIELDDPETAEDNESEILQENHYYPFGMNMDGAWAEQQGERNDYQYNGKEYNDDLGLEWSDYGARWYDASLGRWSSVDPLVDRYLRFSPFVYAINNPILYVDPDGMRVIDNDGIVNRHKERLSSNIKAVEEVLKMSGLSGEDMAVFSNYKSELNNQLNEINTLEMSSQVYNVFYEGSSSDGGATSYNMQTSAIDISIGKGKTDLEESGVVSHELKHGYQYEKGKISLRVKNDGYGVLYDITDETAAYNNQSVLEHGKFYKDNSWSDEKTKKFGATMSPSAYQDLPSGPININSKQGKDLRARTKEAGRLGQPVNEVYKDWQKDYEKGKK